MCVGVHHLDESLQIVYRRMHPLRCLKIAAVEVMPSELQRLLPLITPSGLSIGTSRKTKFALSRIASLVEPVVRESFRYSHLRKLICTDVY